MGLFGKRRDKEPKPADSDPEPPPDWAGFFGAADRYERFEAAVRKHFKDRGVKVLISDGIVRIPPGAPESADFAGEMGLMNLGQWCAGSKESEWAGHIADHFERLRRSHAERVQLESLASDFSEIAPRLAVRLYEPGSLPPKLLEAACSREDIPGLITMLCIDMPDTVHTVTRKQAGKWGQTDDALFDRAIANLDTLIDATPEQVDLDDGAKIWALGGNSFFNASAILRPDRLGPYTGKHGGFVSIPTRHLLLACPFDDAQALNTIAMLIHFTVNFERDGPGSLSRRIWWQRGADRIGIPYEVTDKGISVTPSHEFMKIMEELG